MRRTLLVLLCVAGVASRATAVQNATNQGMFSRRPPYPVAGPQPGKFIEPKPEVPQSTTGYELQLPEFSAVASLQFVDLATASLLALIYSCAFPAFVWIAATARTPLMKSWYSAFNLGFMAFGLTLKALLYLGVLPVLAGLLALIVSATGYFGFRYPDPAYVICGPLWGSYILTNLLHILFVASERNMYLGLGNLIWLLLPTSLAVFGLYVYLERRNRRMSQNFVTAFTSAFAAVAAVSYILSYFFGHERSPFDIVSFMTYPSGFRWSDPEDVAMLGLLVGLVIAAISICISRDSKQDSPGFGDDQKATLGLAKQLVSGGYARVSRTVSSISVDTAPFLTFAGAGGGEGVRRATFSPAVAELRECDLTTLKGREALEESAEDVRDCSTVADSPHHSKNAFDNTSAPPSPLGHTSESLSKDILDEYSRSLESIVVAETEHFCSSAC